MQADPANSPPPSGLSPITQNSTQEEEVASLQIITKSQQPKQNVIYMIKQCLQTASKNRVPSLIFSFLEIFELLRLKTTSTDFQVWVEAYFQQLEFLDLSPFFGYACSEEHILDITYATNPRRSFFMVFQQLCPKRTKLSLAYSTQLTCSALKHFLLPDNWSEKLVGLNLYFCTKLKRVDLADVLCEYAANLTDINLSMIHKLSISGLQRILSSLKQLKRISISGSLKVEQHSGDELSSLEEIESSIQEKRYDDLIFIDCRKCTLLQDREFWTLANEQESNYRAIFGVYQRGQTWILGPHDVGIRDISQLQCLYADCGMTNSKLAIRCKSCQRKLFLADFLKKPSNLFLQSIS